MNTFTDGDQGQDKASNHMTSHRSCNFSQPVHCDLPPLINGYCHPTISLPCTPLHDESATSSVLSLRTKGSTNSSKKSRQSLSSLDRRSLFKSATNGGRRLLRRLSSIFSSPAINRTKVKRKLAEKRRHTAEDDKFIEEYAKNKLNQYQRDFDKLNTLQQDDNITVNEDMDDDEASLINTNSRSKYATTLEHLRSLELPEDNEVNLWNSRVWNRLTFDGFSSVGMIAALLWPAWTESSDYDPTQEMAPYDDVPNWDAKGWHRVVRGTMMWSFTDPFPINTLKWAMVGGDYQAQWLL